MHGKARSLTTFAAAIIIVLMLGVSLRAIPLFNYQGFYEPDGFYHYAVVTAAIADGYGIPYVLSLSGFPQHFIISEPLGLYYLTLIPTYVLHGFGISAYTIMRLLPVLFGALDMVGAYLLGKSIANDRRAGLLSMLLIAISGANAARTYATIYRGDSFISAFLIMALILAIKCVSANYNEKKAGRTSWYYALAASGTVALSLSVWNGAPFVLVTYMAGIALLSICSFIRLDKGMAKGAAQLSATAILIYLAGMLFLVSGIMRAGQPLTGYHFFILYMPILLASCAALAFMCMQKNGKVRRSRSGFAFVTARSRLALSIAFIVISLATMSLLFWGYITHILAVGGLISQTALDRSIQELQKPGPLFLFSSFSFQLLLAPIGVALYLFGMKGRKGIKALRGTMPSFLLLLSYLLVTLYLQVNASRFNSLLSIPMAVFSAYAVWAIASDKSKSTIRIFNDRVNMRATLVGLLVAFIIIEFVVTAAQSAAFSQADGIDPAFLSAMAWMRNSTPANATVLAFWPDGSVIEGWADRTSFMDSVGGQNSALIANFSDFILNSSPDPQYLYDIGRPQYLVVRYLLLDESLPIVEEGNLSASRYYYIQLQPDEESKSQGSSTYGFMAPRGYPYYMVSVTIPNGSLSLPGATLLSTNGTAYNATIIYYNMSSGTYGISDAVGAPSSLPGVLVYLNSTGTVASAALTSSGLADSNLFKLLIECGQASCAYNPGNVSLSIVYSNNDTKIFRLSYR